jgi:hypothetical protein
MDIFLSLSCLSFSCWILPGVNISSTSVRNILPLNRPAMLVVASVNVHLAGVSLDDGGTLGFDLPNRVAFLLLKRLFFPLDTDMARVTGVLSGEITGLGCLLDTARATEEDRGGKGLPVLCHS